jgi:hypothetical protein
VEAIPGKAGKGSAAARVAAKKRYLILAGRDLGITFSTITEEARIDAIRDSRIALVFERT